jgi:hypothetical protein
VNLARQPASRATHISLSVAGDAGSVLVYADNGRVDHLHGRIMRGGQRFHDPVPDTCAPPPNEAIAWNHTSGVRPLRYSINVTLDGCCDHREMVTDEDLHRHAAENLAQADALLFGRVTYE